MDKKIKWMFSLITCGILVNKEESRNIFLTWSFLEVSYSFHYLTRIFPFIFFFFFWREFQPMASALDNNSLLSDQDINQFFGVGGD